MYGCDVPARTRVATPALTHAVLPSPPRAQHAGGGAPAAVEKMPKMKETLRNKSGEYLSRADELKKVIAESKKPTAVTAGGSSKKYERHGTRERGIPEVGEPLG